MYIVMYNSVLNKRISLTAETTSIAAMIFFAEIGYVVEEYRSTR